MRRLENIRVSKEILPEKRHLLRQIRPQAPPTTVVSSSDDEYSDPEFLDSSSCEEEQEDAKIESSTELILKQSIQEETALKISTARFLEVQKEIIPRHREVAVKWLIKLNYEFGYPSDTLHNAIVLFDLLTQTVNMPKDKIQLYAIVCYFVSAKMDVGVVTKLTVEKINEKTGQNFTAPQFAQTEMEIIQACNFKLSYPTVKFFQRVFHDELKDCDACVYELSTFFVEVALIKFDFMDFQPSLIALSAFIFSGLCLGIPTSTPLSQKALQFYKQESIINCITKIREHASSIIQTWSKSESSHIQSLFQRINMDVDIGAAVMQYM